MPSAREREALRALTRAVAGVAEHTSADKFVRVAYTNGAISQAICRVAINLMIEKGMVTHEEVGKRLAESLLECAKEVEDTQLVARGIPGNLVLPS